MATESNVLQATEREGAGKGASRRLRKTGMVPAVVYGKSMEAPAQIAVDPLGIKKAIATPRKLNTLITLKIGSGGERKVLLKDYQQDPVTRAILHADFLAVSENEAVKVNVPVELTGKAIGVAEGGILSVQRRDLEVWALPSAIPEKIAIDVSHLKVAQALHINDIKLPEGVQVKTSVNFTLAVVVAPDKEEVVVAAAPVAAAAGAPAAAGDAKAGDAKAGDAKAGDAKAAPAAKKEDKKK